ALLSLPASRTAPARAGAELRRGWRARQLAAPGRHDPGRRDDQVDPPTRRLTGRAAAARRHTADALPRDTAAGRSEVPLMFSRCSIPRLHRLCAVLRGGRGMTTVPPTLLAALQPVSCSLGHLFAAQDQVPVAATELPP